MTYVDATGRPDLDDIEARDSDEWPIPDVGWAYHDRHALLAYARKLELEVRETRAMIALGRPSENCANPEAWERQREDILSRAAGHTP